MYNSLKAEGKNFEVVFVSADKSPPAFSNYFSIMPWLAIDYSDEATRNRLQTLLGTTSYPTLVLIDTSGNLITTNGREVIDSDPTGINFPWDVSTTICSNDKTDASDEEEPPLISKGEVYIIQTAAKQFAHSAIKEHAANRITDSDLQGVEEEINYIRAKLLEMVPEISIEEGIKKIINDISSEI